MLVGRIVGTVVATQKEQRLEGLKLFVVKRVDIDGGLSEAFVVAADAVGAGLGETVLCATGSAARQTPLTEGRPVDAVVMAIIDTWDANGRVVYDKAKEG
ncbi:MAG: EutN/CcmL family microcompartment protein [bacterium]|jgi:microcompartment protein CcmK/EutM|nr:EutN/CcmL family microcompartment protein [bacterium]